MNRIFYVLLREKSWLIPAHIKTFKTAEGQAI